MPVMPRENSRPISRAPRVLTLLLDDGGDTSNDDEAAWGNAAIYLKPGAPPPTPYVAPAEPAPLIAPARSETRPRVHGPRVTGATPGRPFLFRIPATGQAPLRYQAQGLPVGLTLDEATGIIRGSIRDRGRHEVKLTVTGPKGKAQRALTIVGDADALALTPPMGWNSPECLGSRRRRRQGARRGRVARAQRTRSAWIPVHRDRRRVGRARVMPTERFNPMKNFRTCVRWPRPSMRAD